MAPPPDDPTLNSADEEGGGPVKSFLEHLEDLRWVLVKTASTILVAMLICMAGSPTIMAILRYPLDHPLSILNPKPDRSLVPVHMGTNFLAILNRTDVQIPGVGSNDFNSCSLVPRVINGQTVLALQPDPTNSSFEVVAGRPRLVGLGPMTGVSVSLKLSFWGGLVLSAPFAFFFFAQFILPALHVHEKKLLFKSVGWSIALFLAGVAFCYLILLGVALTASAGITRWLGFASDDWQGEAYLDFVTKFLLGMGLCFQLPVVILLLVKIGLIDYKKLNEWRPYVFVANLIIAAFITPTGDPISLLLFGLPLQLLYEASVLVAWWWARSRRKDETLAPAAGPTLD